MRLDKYLADAGFGSRKDVKDLIKKKRVSVNDTLILDSGFIVTEGIDVIKVDNNEISYKPFVYLLLNKPAGYVTSTSDPKDKTVMDLITMYRQYDLFPVGRLDKDTTGLLLITNDGDYAHKLLSPNHHVCKTYECHIDHELSENDIIILEQGIMMDGKLTKPAKISKVNNCVYEITISEGKYHQVKRMFERVGKQVLALKRLSFGPYILGDIKEGTFIETDKK